jgi:carbon-monoxide dehydrogenase large subunit
VRQVACDDAGKVLNPMLLEGPDPRWHRPGRRAGVDGGGALRQRRQPVTSNLADYAFISAAELPSFEVVHMETPTHLNPLGAKGIGESGTIGSTPAVQSAVIDAVSHLGVRHIDMPCTAEKVWRAINAVTS